MFERWLLAAESTDVKSVLVIHARDKSDLRRQAVIVSLAMTSDGCQARCKKFAVPVHSDGGDS